MLDPVSAGSAVYEVEALTKRYPGQATPANDCLTLRVERGEICGLLGANGAGKTTLVRQLANLLSPTSGSIRLFGRPLTCTPLYTPGLIGYMPQSGYAMNMVTVAETLYFTAHLRGLSRRDARRERDALIDQLNLGALRDRVVPRLSGGQRRLVLLATALAASPPVLILDEPTNDLDPQHRRLVWDTVRAANRERGAAVILVTHNVVEAEQVIERVGIIQRGRLIAVGRPGQLKAGLNHQLRLEILFDPARPPGLPAAAQPRELGPGRWFLLVARAAGPDYVAALAATPAVEAFRLSTATLEDLYLALAEPLSNGQTPETQHAP
jgi:ABC-2 type transport system ATP-binding protein/ABC-2 type transport system permease protein